MRTFNQHTDLSEAKASKIMKNIRGGDGPYTVVVMDGKKVVNQHVVKISTAVPAAVKVARQEHPNAKIAVESRGGQILHTEGFVADVSEGKADWTHKIDGKKYKMVLDPKTQATVLVPEGHPLYNRKPQKKNPLKDEYEAMDEGVIVLPKTASRGGEVKEVGKDKRGSKTEYWWKHKSGLKNVFDSLEKLRYSLRNDANFADAESITKQLGEAKEEVEMSLSEDLRYFVNPKDRKKMFVVSKRDTRGMRGSQDKFSMKIHDTKTGKVLDDIGSHASIEGATKFAATRGFTQRENGPGWGKVGSLSAKKDKYGSYNTEEAIAEGGLSGDKVTVADLNQYNQLMKKWGDKPAHKVPDRISMQISVLGRKLERSEFASKMDEVVSADPKAFRPEEHGAGDEATNKLRKKYTKDTPGQGCVDEAIAPELKNKKLNKLAGMYKSNSFYVVTRNKKILGPYASKRQAMSQVAVYKDIVTGKDLEQGKYKDHAFGKSAGAWGEAAKEKKPRKVISPELKAREAAARKAKKARVKKGGSQYQAGKDYALYDSVDHNIIDEAATSADKAEYNKLKEARRLTPAQKFLKKKAEDQVKKDDPGAFEPGANRYQKPTKKHVGIKPKDKPKGKKGKSFDRLREEPMNVVGTGNIAGTIGDPPVRKSAKKKKFAGCDVFEVDSSTYNNCRRGKLRTERFAKFIGDGPVLEEIREYARQYPSSGIMIKDSATGAMTYLKYPKGKSGAQF